MFPGQQERGLLCHSNLYLGYYPGMQQIQDLYYIGVSWVGETEDKDSAGLCAAESCFRCFILFICHSWDF